MIDTMQRAGDKLMALFYCANFPRSGDSMSVNKVILVGNLGKDPEVRYTQTGSAVANFSIATSEQWNDRDGKRQERTEWHNIVVWGKQAESCGQYLSKGRQVYVEGSIRTRSATTTKAVTSVTSPKSSLSGFSFLAAAAARDGAADGCGGAERNARRWQRCRRR